MIHDVLGAVKCGYSYKNGESSRVAGVIETHHIHITPLTALSGKRCGMIFTIRLIKIQTRQIVKNIKRNRLVKNDSI